MKQYWPMAVALDNYGKPAQLFTYDSCNSVLGASKVFKCWQNDYDYQLLTTWIDVTEDGERDIINHRCHVNNLGQVKKI